MDKKENKGIIHGAFFIRNTRKKENLSSLFGQSQGTDMDMYDYEFDKEGQLIVIHKEQDE